MTNTAMQAAFATAVERFGPQEDMCAAAVAELVDLDPATPTSTEQLHRTALGALETGEVPVGQFAYTDDDSDYRLVEESPTVTVLMRRDGVVRFAGALLLHDARHIVTIASGYGWLADQSQPRPGHALLPDLESCVAELVVYADYYAGLLDYHGPIRISYRIIPFSPGMPVHLRRLDDVTGQVAEGSRPLEFDELTTEYSTEDTAQARHDAIYRLCQQLADACGADAPQLLTKHAES